MIYKNILENLGNTPLVKIESSGLSQINLFGKLECYNPTGSMKDRAAYYILKKTS